MGIETNRNTVLQCLDWFHEALSPHRVLASRDGFDGSYLKSQNDAKIA